MFIQKRAVTAAEEIEEEVIDTPEEEVVDTEVEVAPEATDLLFEAEDVAELLAEVTDQVVEVAVDGEDVIFTVGEDEFTVTPEGDEELLESSTKVMKKSVAANKKNAPKRPVQASKAPDPKPGKALRKIRK